MRGYDRPLCVKRTHLTANSGGFLRINVQIYAVWDTPLKYTDPDGNSIKSAFWRAVGVAAFIGAGLVGAITITGIITSGGTLSVGLPAAVKGMSGLASAGVAAFSTVALVDVMDVATNNASVLTASDKKPKSEQEMKPDDAPTGTKPIDQAGLDTATIHEVKSKAGLGAHDWTGISPDGDVIINDGNGKAANLGPYTDYTH
jgi:hypothetical protein